MHPEIPHFKQEKLHHCGPAVMKMVFSFYGLEKGEQEIADAMKTNEEDGTSLPALLKYAKEQGFNLIHKDGAKLSQIQEFISQKHPVIVNYQETERDEGHFALVIEITDKEVVMNDPWHGPLYAIDKEEFKKRWHNQKMTRQRTIIVITPKEPRHTT
jgi:ABC-type bacteriocin/lantibiotic exporter with double-glycine peptidase domain